MRNLERGGRLARPKPHRSGALVHMLCRECASHVHNVQRDAAHELHKP